MENNNNLQEISLAEVIQKISLIISKNKLAYFLVVLFVFFGAAGLFIKAKLNPEYKAQVLLGSEALNLSTLKVIVEDINLQIAKSEANQKFNKTKSVYSKISDVNLGEIKIHLADEKSKDLNAFKLEMTFSNPQNSMDFEEISNLIFTDIENKAQINILISEKKNEISKNIETINNSISKAEETEAAIRENIKNNKDVSIIGITEFYTDLNNLITKKNSLEKDLFFYEKGNLIYKLTDFSFDNNSPSNIKLLAYSIFLSIFLSFIFTIYKLIIA